MRIPIARAPMVDYQELLGPLDYECPLNPERIGYWNGPLPSRFASMSDVVRLDAGLFVDPEADEVMFEVGIIGDPEFVGRKTRVPLQMGLIWHPEPGWQYPVVFIPAIWLWIEDWEFESACNITPVERTQSPFISGLWEMAWEGRR